MYIHHFDRLTVYIIFFHTHINVALWYTGKKQHHGSRETYLPEYNDASRWKFREDHLLSVSITAASEVAKL